MASAPANATAPFPQQLLDDVSKLIGRRSIIQNEYSTWLTGTATGGPMGDGRYPLTAPDGSVTLIAAPAAVMSKIGTGHVGPEIFGAIGDGQSHPARFVYATLADCQKVYPRAVSLAQEMDFLAWQKMVDTTGQYRCPSKRTYKMCNSDPSTHVPLSWCAGIADVDVNYGTLDWSDLRQVVSNEHRIPDYNFSNPPGGWYNTSDYDNQPGWIIYAKFKDGYAECIDDKVHIGDRNPYYEFKHNVTLPPGRWRAIMRARAKRGQSFNFKNPNPAYCTIHLFGLADRASTVFPTFDTKDPENVWTEVTAQFDFETTKASTTGGIVFKGGGYLDLQVYYYDIVPFIPNCAILNHRDGPVEHYFISRRLRKCNLKGPTDRNNAIGLSGGLWKSFASIDGSLQDWELVKGDGWFEHVLNWSDGAYLINYFMCDIGNSFGGLYFGPGSVNAGENIKFFYGSVSGGPLAFNNPGGAEFTTTGCILDYNEQCIINNAGIIRIIGTRMEQQGVKVAGRPIIHCTTGKVHFIGSYMLMAGGVNSMPSPPLQLDTNMAIVEFINSQTYNLSSASGVSASGPGRVNFIGWSNLGNPNMGPDLISESRTMDVFGGAGTFEPQANGASYFLQNDPSGIDLIGGVYATDQGDGVMLDRWNHTYLKCSVSTDRFRSGTRSLKIQKLSGDNNNVYRHVAFFVPLPAPGNLVGRMFFLCPDVIPGAPTMTAEGKVRQYPIYVRQFYCTITRYDVLGRPIIGSHTQFKGEDDIYIDGTGEVEWRKRALTTTYSQPVPFDDANERSPNWATHYMIAIDVQNLPAMSFYIDDMKANFLG